MMKVLTLHQPYASLIAIGAKTIETRSWPTKYRGPLAIHAGKEWSGNLADPGVLGCHFGIDTFYLSKRDMPLGAIVATCELVDCAPIVEWGADPQCNHITVGADGALRSWEFVVGSMPLAWRKQGRFDVTDQAPYGDFTPGRWAWLLDNIRPLAEPVPSRGRQGLWDIGDAAVFGLTVEEAGQ